MLCYYIPVIIILIKLKSNKIPLWFLDPLSSSSSSSHAFQLHYIKGHLQAVKILSYNPISFYMFKLVFNFKAGSFCMEFACSPHVCVGCLWLPQLCPTFFACLSLSARCTFITACIVQQCWLVRLSSDTKKLLKRYPLQLMNLFEQLSHSFGFTVTVFTLVALIKSFKARTIMYLASSFGYCLLSCTSLLTVEQIKQLRKVCHANKK